MLNAYKGGWRIVKTDHGDTLQRIAHRELQDASRWPEIAWLNKLMPPYLAGDTATPGVATGRVLLWGSSIRIPAPTLSRPGVSAEQALGIDVSLADGLLSADDSGALSMVSGVPNVHQALELRLRNERGCLPFHPTYGNAAHRLIGRKSSSSSGLIALRFCEESVLSDPRVAGVKDGAVEVVGDGLKVTVFADVDGSGPLPVQVEI